VETFKKKIDFVFFQVPLAQAKVCVGLCRRDQEKKSFYFFILESCHRRPSALLHKVVRYRTRLQSCPYRPYALTHKVYEGNFEKKIDFFFDFFYPACIDKGLRWQL
jgi:hypothetical protein